MEGEGEMETRSEGGGVLKGEGWDEGWKREGKRMSQLARQTDRHSRW